MSLLLLLLTLIFTYFSRWLTILGVVAWFYLACGKNSSLIFVYFLQIISVDAHCFVFQSCLTVVLPQPLSWKKKQELWWLRISQLHVLFNHECKILIRVIRIFHFLHHQKYVWLVCIETVDRCALRSQKEVFHELGHYSLFYYCWSEMYEYHPQK